MHQNLIKDMLIEKTRDESLSEMKWSLSMVKCLLHFTCFCPVEVIPVKKTWMRIHSEMKKKKKRCVNTLSRDEILHLTLVLTDVLNMLSDFNRLEQNKSYKKDVIGSFCKK